jgi:hypothetical protein
MLVVDEWLMPRPLLRVSLDGLAGDCGRMAHAPISVSPPKMNESDTEMLILPLKASAFVPYAVVS